MQTLEKWLTGFTLTVTLLNCAHFATSNDDCKETPPQPNAPQDVIIDCEYVSEVPQDLKETITILHLDSPNQLSLTNNCFAKYPNLVEFEIFSPKVSTSSPKADPLIFQKTKLKLINIGNGYYDTKFQWPATLTHLTVTYNKFPLDVSYLDKLEFLNAKYYNLTEIPKIHPLAPITMLELNGNPFKGDLDFSNFKNLQKLLLNSCGLKKLPKLPKSSVTLLSLSTNSFETGTELDFSNLKTLKTLILESCNLQKVPKLPESTMISLELNDNNFEKGMDLPSINNLSFLSADSCKLPDMPKMQELLPITTLSLLKNPLNNLTAESLSHYCQLDLFNLNFKVDSASLTPEKYCKCSRAQKWWQGITNTTKMSGIQSFDCGESTNEDLPKIANCSFEFEEAMQNRNNCLTKFAANSDSSFNLVEIIGNNLILVIAVIAVSLFFLLIVITFGYRMLFKKSGEESEDVDEPESAIEEETED